MGKTHDSQKAQDYGLVCWSCQQLSCDAAPRNTARQTALAKSLLVTGCVNKLDWWEPCAVKVASTVLREPYGTLLCRNTGATLQYNWSSRKSGWRANNPLDGKQSNFGKYYQKAYRLRPLAGRLSVLVALRSEEP